LAASRSARAGPSSYLVHRFHETARLFRIQLGFDSLNGVEDHDSMAAGD
jgi:hypothetical protein